MPAAVAEKMRGPVGGTIGREAAGLLTGNGGAMDNAMRVFRTEINRAHGEAYMAGGEGKPYFGGWRYLLSPQHPEPDICDLLATQNLHGLGQGVYPDRERCPWPAHPNTLSFVVMVFDEDVSDADRAGRETALQALQASPLLGQYPDLDPAVHKIGIFGKPCSPDTQLQAGDRVEIYLPLQRIAGDDEDEEE